MMKKIILYVGGTSLIVLITLSFWLRSHKPNYSGKVVLEKLSNPVEVYRDKFGIPHIIGDSEEDTQRVLGYVMAQDRLFQMEVLRRIVNGELSEILGRDALKHDILLRKLMLKKTMEEFLTKNKNQINPKVFQMANAFLEGVNKFIKEDNLPIEFKLLGYKPRPFKLGEVFGVSGYLALSFAEGFIADPLRSDLQKTLTKEQIEELFGQDRGSIKNYIQNKSTSYIKAKWFKDLLSSLDFFENSLGLFHGSNSWVVSGKRSQSGFPLLLNDPHVAFANPGVWYEAHIKSPEHEIYGHYVPMVPFPSLGHNRNLGWAVTMAEVDDLDLYREKIDWEKQKVMFKGEWVDLKSYKEVIKVKGEKDHHLSLYITPHGPLIDGTEYAAEGENLSIKWSYHHPENNIAQTIYELGHAKNVDDYKKALKHGAAPGLNISWADKEGNIGWHILSKIPLRPEGVSGRQVLEGWSGAHEYTRYLDISENPHQYNPPSGVIVTANYYPEWTQFPLEGYWQPAERFKSINKAINQKEKWSLDEMKRLQTTQHVTIGTWTLQKLFKAIGEGENAQEKEALAILKKWDGNSSITSVGSMLWHQWQKEVIRAAILDELGEKRLAAYGRVADIWHFFKTIMRKKDSRFWDNISTPEKETKDMILRNAFKKSLEKLTQKLGSNMDQWKWGKLHTIEFKHLFGEKKPLNRIFNLGPYPAGGGPAQIDNMSVNRSQDNFFVTLGPSVRRAIDFSNPALSFGVLPTGNSGNLFSDFYKDQVEMFLGGQYRHQHLDLEMIKKESAYKLEFNPK